MSRETNKRTKIFTSPDKFPKFPVLCKEKKGITASQIKHPQKDAYTQMSSIERKQKTGKLFWQSFFYDTTMELKKRLTVQTTLNSKQNYMKYNRDINFFRAVLICLVILVHIVNFGDIYPNAKIAISAFIMPSSVFRIKRISA